MNKIGIIIGREYSQRVKKRSFILTTILTPLLMMGLMAVMVWAMVSDVSAPTQREIRVIDLSGLVAGKLEDTGTLHFVSDNRTLQEARQSPEEAFGYLVIGADVLSRPDDVQLYSYEPSTLEIDAAITRQIKDILEAEKLKRYDIENLGQILAEIDTRVRLSTYRIDSSTDTEQESSSILSYGVAFLSGFMIYLFILLYGGMVMQGVIREKSSKVLEIMVSSVRPFPLMFGKIIGIALVALTQLAIWVVLLTGAVALIGGQLAGGVSPEAASQVAGQLGGMGMMNTETLTQGMDPSAAAMLSTMTDVGFVLKMVLCFALFFIGGYLLYAALFAAVGSAVDNEADTQQLQLPLSMPLILGFVVMYMAIRDPSGAMATWFSLIPFTSPIVMMARLPYGMPTGELILSLVLLYATFVAVVWMAGKIYRIGILMYGKKATWKDLIKWISYKG
ncbi:MAG: ABC transporter permease [Rikenellaceae bacterium]|jgi:ABC-2 type transport system permease protein|nr:ABC transporter permease [Rikenellaceae bacterium]